MGHKKVPVLCKTTVQRKFCVPFCSIYIFPCLFLLRGQNYFMHMEQWEKKRPKKTTVRRTL